MGAWWCLSCFLCILESRLLPLLLGVTAVAWAAGSVLSKRKESRKHHVAEREENAVGDNRSQADSVAHPSPPESQELINSVAVLCWSLCSCPCLCSDKDWTVENLTTVFGWLGLELEVISFRQDLGWLLPVGISFFTFQAVAYVVDVWRSGENEHSFFDSSLFWRFFLS